ncbi:F0F1 ATP synthase subunit B [Mesorhizobium sp. SP-1A]|uniref:F0F1 ATP synthase subunit B n=1 Tax=Mesorhizobium sp. SP-1A TaxID=3077840 RepID=UPI0028F711C4|nr:F0F1 ATP synthase subunit B [Mesorhizobium sp. SP-1A]
MFVTPAYGQEAAPAVESGAGAEGTHAGTEVPGNAGHEGGTFPPFNPATFPSQILWLAITFGLFYLFLKKVALPRLGGILEERSGRIARDLDQAAKLKGEADAAVAAYEQALAEAKANANAIGQQARDAAKAEAEDARKAVEAGLETKLAEAEKRIADIKASAMKDVGTIAESTATAIVEQLVGKADKSAIAAAVAAGR